jgi:Protein of unknown function (DUF2971)
MWKEELIACLEKSTVGNPRVEEALAIKQQHLPKLIYKYRQVCPRHLDNLTRDTVRLSLPESFNDPYDCWLTLADDLVTTLIERRILETFVRANKLQSVIPAAQIESASKSPEPLKELIEHLPKTIRSATRVTLKERAEKYAKKVKGVANDVASIPREWRKMVKLCSFSAVNNSLLMWSHYSVNHTGFCIEYNLEVLDASHPFRHHLYPVVYSNKLYGLRLYAEKLVALNRQEFTPMLPLLAMLHKFDGWQYEEEWRMIFEQGTEVDDQPAPIPSRIFLGSKMDTTKCEELLAICQQKSIPVLQMRLADDRFELLPVPFNLA